MLLDQPAHLQPFAQPQLLDARIDARDLEFVAQRNLTMRVGEVEPEQVGEVLDRRLGAHRIRSRQRRDGVHAVEQEVRTDARLERADPCARLELDVAAPLMGHMEVPQRQHPDDRRDADIGQQEFPVLARENS